MTSARVEFMSAALGKQASYNMLLPDVGEGSFPVLIQLHGLSDDANAWIERSNIVRHAADYPLAIIFPDGGTSAWLNWKHAGRLGRQNYEDLIIQDITGHVKRHFDVKEGPWAIGGLSMGGYGAMRLGLKYADRFASIWSHSSKLIWGDAFDPALLADPDDVDVFARADRVAMLHHTPAISFDCGVEDDLIGENRAFHDHLEKIGLKHHYAEFDGAHDWDYWDLHVQKALAQHSRVLEL